MMHRIVIKTYPAAQKIIESIKACNIKLQICRYSIENKNSNNKAISVCNQLNYACFNFNATKTTKITRQSPNSLLNHTRHFKQNENSNCCLLFTHNVPTEIMNQFSMHSDRLKDPHT